MTKLSSDERRERRLALSRAYRRKHPEKFRVWDRKKKLRSQYGLELEDYDALLEKQGGKCALCPFTPTGTGRFEILHVDHDHETKKIRGLLCNNCNLNLGRLGDTVESFEKILAYLKGESIA